MTCGDFGGVTTKGLPCKRTAGWGVPGVDDGPCRDHLVVLAAPTTIVAADGYMLMAAADGQEMVTGARSITVTPTEGEVMQPPVFVAPVDGGVHVPPYPVEIDPGTDPLPEDEPIDIPEVFGDVGAEHMKILLAVNAGGDGVTSTANNPWPWYDSNARAKGDILGSYFPAPSLIATPGQTPPGWTASQWLHANYYDQALCQYGRSYHDNNPVARDYARKIADSWYRGPWVAEGTYAHNENSHTPRNAGITGMMLRAIDGRPEMWDWLYKYTDYHFWLWIERHNHLAGGGVMNGYRDPGYSLLYPAQICRVLPDVYPKVGGGTITDGAGKRAALVARLETILANQLLPVQKPDGSWRWSSNSEGIVNTVPYIFMGLFIEGLCAAYFAIGSSAIKAEIVQRIAAFADFTYSGGPYRPTDQWRTSACQPYSPPRFFRTLWYFYGGGTVLNPTAYATGGGSKAAGFCIGGAQGGDGNTPREERQIGMGWLVRMFGWLYHVTGDASWLAKGDEWMASLFGNGVGPGADMHYCIADTISISAPNQPLQDRNYCQAYRTSGQYLGFRSIPPLVTP